MRSSTLVGRIGTVVHAVRGDSGPGEVRVVVAGIAHYYIAYAPTPIPIGTEVLVINSRGDRQVDVEPWTGLSAGGNGAGSWVAAGEGLPNVEVAGLTIVPGARKLYAATHGRSAWVLTLP